MSDALKDYMSSNSTYRNAYYPVPYEYAFAFNLARANTAFNARYPQTAFASGALSSDPGSPLFKHETPFTVPEDTDGAGEGLRFYDDLDQVTVVQHHPVEGRREPAPSPLLRGTESGDDAPSLSASRHASLTGPATPAKLSPAVARTRRKGIRVKLRHGFRWDRDSLAQLCRWRKVHRRDSQACIDGKLFPGHTKESLDEVWVSRREEAEQAFDQLWPGHRKEG